MWHHYQDTISEVQLSTFKEQKKQPGNRPFFKISVTGSNTNTYSNFPKVAISWLEHFLAKIPINQEIDLFAKPL